MRVVGKKKERQITLKPSFENLERCIKFNDDMNQMFGSRRTGVKKGVYHFKSHSDANDHSEMCIANNIVRFSLRNSA